MRRCFQLVVIAALTATPVLAQNAPAPAVTVIAAADADEQAPLSDAAMDTLASDAPVVSDSPVPAAAATAVPAAPAESLDVPPLTDPVALIGPPMPAPDTKDRRCTADGRSCIAVATYVADVCSTIEKVR